MVPERTLHRYALEVLGVGRSARTTTVRVADGEPGSELQVDFGKMGLIADPDSGRRRVVWALIFTACYSRHCFVWLSFRQTTEAVIAGFEAAWRFFGGYAGDLVKHQTAVRNHDAWSSSRVSKPSKIFWRPRWPLAAASSRCRCRVGRNSTVVTKNEQDSQIDSKWQSISTGRAQ